MDRALQARSEPGARSSTTGPGVTSTKLEAEPCPVVAGSHKREPVIGAVEAPGSGRERLSFAPLLD